MEEAIELENAIYKGQANEIVEELGDLLFQVVLHAQILEENSTADLDSIARTLSEKLTRRHPHVFGGEKLGSPEAVQKQWREIKLQEKSNLNQDLLAPKVAEGLPALRRAQKIGEKSNELKFDWNSAEEVWAKVEEELLELKEASSENKEEEFGDVLFSLVQWARHQGMESEGALQKANLKFETRFGKVLARARSEGLNWDLLTSADKEKLWSDIKSRE